MAKITLSNKPAAVNKMKFKSKFAGIVVTEFLVPLENTKESPSGVSASNICANK